MIAPLASEASVTTSLAPEPNPDRPRGFVEFPIACPRCARALHDVQLVRSDGGIRCHGCNSMLYVLIVAPEHLAFVAEVTARELAYAQRERLSLARWLRFLGAGFPPVAHTDRGAGAARRGRIERGEVGR